jgi:hypothetical protein
MWTPPDELGGAVPSVWRLAVTLDLPERTDGNCTLLFTAEEGERLGHRILEEVAKLRSMGTN